jgi:hypothetical protein
LLHDFYSNVEQRDFPGIEILLYSKGNGTEPIAPQGLAY